MHTVITGAASGIGLALAQRLAAGGGRVSVIDRLAADECAWWDDLPPASRGDWCVADVSDRAAVRDAVGHIARTPIDGLATCAGIVTSPNVLDAELDEIDRIIAVNLGGTLAAAQAVARHLVAQQRGGSIVTVMSTAGLGYVAGLGVGYHISKAAIAGLTRSMAGDLAAYAVRVNAVAPGLVRTPMTAAERSHFGEECLAARVPAGRLSEPEDVAAGIAWLLSPASALTTGHVLPIDGGQMSVAGAPAEGFPLHERTGVTA